eukprot:TRINITY_DN60931_c0_g1_i1.p3 TRINITY_DN60931_c0_g1~~TRINITY_DN60931_c0_g1_i1.p3  ORF type:complete len:127 (+),score=19.06 TRINITY_DN60931_c0_g1_i1:894-1274(+)
MNQLATDFSEHADFLGVYIQEAHAADVWPLGSHVVVNKHKTVEERISACWQFMESTGWSASLPMVVDNIDDSCMNTFTAHPERYYVLDKEGCVLTRGEPSEEGLGVPHDLNDLRQFLDQRCKTTGI